MTASEGTKTLAAAAKGSPASRVFRLIAAGAAAATALLYFVNLFLNPYAGAGRLPAGYVVVIVMMGLGVAGVYFAIKGRWYLMYGVFILWFVPFGLYMLLTPGIFQLIGHFNLIFLVATVMIHLLGRRRSREATI